MPSKWAYSAGKWGENRIRVFERSRGGIIYAAATDRTNGKTIRVSLGHRDRERAKVYADRQAAKLREGMADINACRPTLGRILSAYLEQVLPLRKSDAQRDRDEQRRECWVNYLGRDKDPTKITPADWLRFQRERTSGAIDARGKTVPDEQRQPVRARTIIADCVWLRGALNWACDWQLPNGQPLLRDNPTSRKGAFKLPQERNPRRVVASQERFEAIRSVARLVKCRGGRTYLPELLEIALHTGRRISAICCLTYEDLNFKRSRSAPFGTIRWRSQHDKQGRETVIPINESTREALDAVLRDRPGIGGAWIFPNPDRPTEPLPRHLAQGWLKRAERLAGLDHVLGFGWHSFRRTWATSRKHLPAPDVAAAGGWKGPHTLMYVYQQPDAETLLSVVLEPAQVREETA